MKAFLAAMMAMATLAIGCSDDSTTPSPSTTPPAELAESQEALVTGVVAAAQGSLPFSAAVHGVGGTKALLFALVPEPSSSTPVGVFASSRLTGAFRGSFPAPPEGFRVPLSIKILNEGFLGESGVAIVLDARAKPAEIGRPGQQPPTLYKYAFSNSFSGFSATLIDSFALPINTVDPTSGFPPNGLVFPGSIAVLPGDDGVVVTDNFGAMWQVRGQITSPSGSGGPSTAVPRLLDRRFVGRPGGPVTGIGKIGPGSGTIGPFTLLTPPPPYPVPPGLGIYPGMHSVSYHVQTDAICFSVTVPGGVYCAPRSLLLNDAIPFFAKTNDNPTLPEDFAPSAFGGVKQVVSPPPADPSGWLMDGWDTDRTGSDPSGYYVVAPTNELFQVNLTSPSCAVVGPCPKINVPHGGAATIFNWANEISVLPPLVPELRVTNLVISVGQEFNNPAVNSLLAGSERYFGPAYYGRVWLGY